MKYKYIIILILFALATSAIAEGIKGDANGDGRVSVTDITAVASYILGNPPTNFDLLMADANGDGRVSVTDISALVTLIMGGEVESAKKDTIYIKYSENDVAVVGEVDESVHIIHDQADIKVVIEKNPNIVINLSGKSDNGRFAINADTLVTLQLAGVNLTSSHAPAINSYGKQKIHVELVDGTNNSLKDSKTYSFNDSLETANGCLSAQGALTFCGKGMLTIHGKSKHAIYAKKSITFMGGSYEVLEASSDAIHSGKSVTIESGVFKLNGMKSDAIELDNDFTMKEGTLEMNITGEGAKGIKCGGDLNISGGTIHATASGAIKNKDGDLSYCSIIKCDGNALISGGNYDLINNSPGGKCISSENDLVISGGKYNIETHGNGAAYINTSNETDYYTSRCLLSKGNMTIVKCDMECLSTGIGGKGIDSGAELTIGTFNSTVNDQINIRVTTKGTCIVDNVDEDKRFGCPKGIKGDGMLYIYGGNIYVETQGMGGEGIESKSLCKIVDGTIECNTYDDGINVDEDLTIEGGQIYCISQNNDGIDSNHNLYIRGGIIASISKKPKEESFDADSGEFVITGGTLFGIGNSKVYVTESTQNFYQPEKIDPSGTSRLGFSANCGKILSIADGERVIMSLKNMNPQEEISLFICSSDLEFGKKYSVYESDELQNISCSYFGEKFSKRGSLSSSSKKTHEIIINNLIYQKVR